jgi:hypothetical protein
MFLFVYESSGLRDHDLLLLLPDKIEIFLPISETAIEFLEIFSAGAIGQLFLHLGLVIFKTL